LASLCLISFLDESEALILLDEPEVHFNDKWKRQLVFMLNQSLKGQSILKDPHVFNAWKEMLKELGYM